MNIQKWLNKNTRSLNGKRIAVTGSTGGLGRRLCGYLAFLGASLVLLDRNQERSHLHKQELIQKYGTEVICIPLELEDIQNVESVAKELIKLNIDIFIHNAGAYSIKRRKCSTGYDNVFQINFASPYYLIKRLIPYLNTKNGKVIAVGSIAHNYSKIDETDIDFVRRDAASKVYGNAKRYLMFSLFELFKEETEVSLSIVHPGITFTNITAHYPKLIFAVIKHPMKVIFCSPKKAALSLVYGVFVTPEHLSWIGPRLFNIWGYPDVKKLGTCKSDERQKIFKNAEIVYKNCENAVKEGEHGGNATV